MARIRTIKPEFWESESVGRLSFGARLLFLACLNFADDEGLLRWNEAYLASQAFVYDESITESISELMSELVREKMIFPYRAGQTNQRLAWIVSFRKHQVINRPQPSKLPPPSIQNIDFHAAIFQRDGMRCALCGNEIASFGVADEVGSLVGSIDHITPKSKGGSDYPSNLQSSHLSCNKGKGNRSLNDSVVEGKGKEGKGSKKNKTALPEPFEISERVKSWAAEKGHTRLNEHLENFVSACRRNGYTYVDWDEALMEAIRKDWAKLGSSQQQRIQVDA